MRRNVVFAMAALVAGAGAIAACGDADRASTSPSPPSGADVSEAERALRAHGGELAGTMSPEVVTSVGGCTARVGGSGLFDCSVGQGVGGEDPVALVVRLQPDRTVSKVLGGTVPVPGTGSSAQAAALLAADDRVHSAPSRSTAYRCSPSPQLDTNGQRTGSGASGQLCTTRQRVGDRAVRRYVEFAPDGTVTRDYVLVDA